MELLEEVYLLFKSFEESKEPTNILNNELKSELFPHQVDGLNWLIWLYKNNLNGILGDERGLGKRTQSLSFLSYLVECNDIKGPFLILSPLSCIRKWEREIEHFLPNFKVETFVGSIHERKEKIERINEYRSRFKDNSNKYSLPFNIMLTSYEFVIKANSVFQQFQWKYVIIDEAQRFTNVESKLYKVFYFLIYTLYYSK